MAAPKDHTDMLHHKAEVPTKTSTTAAPKDHHDMLQHKGDVNPPKTPLNPKALNLLVHQPHTPSTGDYQVKPAPYLEDGVTIWQRDGTAKKAKKRLIEDTGDEDEDDDDAEVGGKVAKENDPLWNIDKRSPVKSKEGEFEKDFRSRDSYSGKQEEKEEDEEGAKDDKTDDKAKVPKHLQCDPIWSLKWR